MKMIHQPFLAVAIALSMTSFSQAQTVNFDFVGNGGVGLLPGNEVGGNTPVAPGAAMSSATGGEAGDGLVFNRETSVLFFDFDFSGLSGGLANAASGIHFHEIASTNTAAPFDGTGPIAFNLNSGTDTDVTLSTSLLATDGSVTGGRVTGSAELDAGRVLALDEGRLYLNIHSGDFGGGELRANLVQAIPEPSSAFLLLGGVSTLLLRRRRK